MERHFDQSLRSLKDELVLMANLVQEAFEIATFAIQNGDLSRFQKVFEIEKKVNQAHIQIDRTCLKLLALQQPLGADLRLIVAIIKINTDLERMGDQAVNIAKNAERYFETKSKDRPVKVLDDLPVMVTETRFMVGKAMDSFIKNDERIARSVLKSDDQVDALKHKIFRTVLEGLKDDPRGIEEGLALILIARNLERIGDHSTNIAEDVIFAISGEDIRHSGSLGSV